jgi:hypothetical protein
MFFCGQTTNSNVVADGCVIHPPSDRFPTQQTKYTADVTAPCAKYFWPTCRKIGESCDFGINALGAPGCCKAWPDRPGYPGGWSCQVPGGVCGTGEGVCIR